MLHQILLPFKLCQLVEQPFPFLLLHLLEAFFYASVGTPLYGNGIGGYFG